MKLFIKSFEAKSDKDTGTITGYFSTYDRIPDSYGDIIEPGAFTETIESREKSGHPFPLCWNHDLDQIIGKVEKIEDTKNGPMMTASFFDTPLAQEKRSIVQSGVVYQFSFAYNVLESRTPTEDEKKKGITNVLVKIDLFEVSIVPIPANPRAEVTDIKSGKRNSKQDAETIKQAIALLQSVLDEADQQDAEEEPNGNPEGKDREELNARKERLLEAIQKMKMEE